VRRLLPRLAAPLAVTVALGVLLPPAPAWCSWMVAPRPYQAKDFTIVKRGALFHVFYTRTNMDEPSQSELDLGHATSTDLYFWEQQPPVLHVRPGSWDDSRVWAPHVVERGGVYYMFYTGVSDRPTMLLHQRTGLAVSTDLVTWNRFDYPVLACADVPWTVCDTLNFWGGNFRDPFVMADPFASRGWLMLYAAKASSDAEHMVVGLAASKGNPRAWYDVMPLGITSWSSTGRWIAESPHMFLHDGLWHLFFTTDAYESIWFATTDNPLGPAESWTLRGTLGAMVGLNTSLWFASEHFMDGTHEYFAFVNHDRVDVREMQWQADGRFTLNQPGFFHVTGMSWSQPEVISGQDVELRIESTGWPQKWALIDLFEVDADGSEEPVPPAAVGLPDSIRMVGPTTVVKWAARAWPDSTDPDGDAHSEFVVRLRDRTAQTAPVVVIPADPTLGGGGSGRTPEDRYVDPARIAPAPPSGLGLRALSDTPLGEQPALLVEMPEEGAARVDLFDVQGRRLARLADRTLPRGATVLVWEGRDAGGARAARGVYFARLHTRHGVRWTRFVVTR
jgi:glycosyl hydrolase family 43